MVGLYEPSMARRFCSEALVRYITRSVASFWFLEYFDTASCQPPSVAALRPLAPPLGSATTPTLPLIVLSELFARFQPYGQLRMNPALPDWNTPRASSSP